MSDTPISDSTAHNVTELGMLCRRLERELFAATSEIARLTNKVAQLYRGSEEQKQRIKRLEEAGDALYEGWIGYGFTKDKHLAAWLKAKEAKP